MLTARSVVLLAVLAAVTVSGCYLSHERPRDAAAPDAAAPDAVLSDSGIECGAMRIAGPHGCTIGGRSWWWWDGRECAGSDCPCSGSDCGRSFASEAGCRAAFSGCAAPGGVIGPRISD